MGPGNRGGIGSFILIHEATTISFWKTTATNGEGLLVLDVFDSFPTYFTDSRQFRAAFLISWHVLSLLQPPCWLPAALAVTLVAALLPSSPLAPCPMLPIRWLVPTVLLVVSAFLRLLRQLPPLLPLSMILTGTLLWLPSLTHRLIWFPVAVGAPVVVVRAVSNVCCVCTGHNKLLIRRCKLFDYMHSLIM